MLTINIAKNVGLNDWVVASAIIDADDIDVIAIVVVHINNNSVVDGCIESFVAIR